MKKNHVKILSLFFLIISLSSFTIVEEQNDEKINVSIEENNDLMVNKENDKGTTWMPVVIQPDVMVVSIDFLD